VAAGANPRRVALGGPLVGSFGGPCALYATKALADLVWQKDAAGSLRATFSTFNVVDHDGDVTLPSAFQDGQPVPMVWSHDWARPVGRGRIEIKTDRAVFAGTFNLKTSWGRDAYESVKDMGELQEYSYGYAPIESEPGTMDGQNVRFLKRLQVFEVSPVLVGAGKDTGTERIKAAGLDDLEEADELLKAAWTAAYINTLPDSAFAVILPGGEKDGEGKTVPRSLRKLPHHDAGGTIDLPHLRNALARLPQSDLPAAAATTARRHLEGHASAAGVGERSELDHEALEAKPMAGEHRCRLHPPDRYDRFRRVNDAARHDGKRIDHVFGHATAGGAWEIQSLALPTSDWDAGAARSYCSSRGGGFEAAKGLDADEFIESFVDHGDRVLAAVRVYQARATDIAALRARDGRSLSDGHRARLSALQEALAAVRGDCQALLTASPAPPAGVDLEALFEQFRRVQARHGGGH